MQSVIRKWGNSAGAIIPARLLAKAGLQMGDAVDMEARDGVIVIRHSQPDYDLEGLLAATPVKCLQRNEEDRLWLGDQPRGRELI